MCATSEPDPTKWPRHGGLAECFSRIERLEAQVRYLTEKLIKLRAAVSDLNPELGDDD